MTSNVYGRITGGPTGITGTGTNAGYGGVYGGGGGGVNHHGAHGSHIHGSQGISHGNNPNDSNFHNSIGPEDYLGKPPS